jgi:hypothetical protein
VIYVELGSSISRVCVGRLHGHWCAGALFKALPKLVCYSHLRVSTGFFFNSFYSLMGLIIALIICAILVGVFLYMCGVYAHHMCVA